MPMIDEREKTIRYITERRCESGGYCFYRLDEPNAGDTFFALTSLALLDALSGDDTTLSYLHTFQRPDGSFTNIPVGHAVVRSLLVLGERPRVDPAQWILSSLEPPGEGDRPIESVSLFGQVYLLADLCPRLGITIPANKKEDIINAVLRYRHPDSGFGHPFSTIIETAHAVSILATLGYPVSSAGSKEFVKQCEDLTYGFLAVPGAKPSFLEHIHAGVLACSMLGYHSPELLRCEEFIGKCCHENGGYIRSVFGGTATLENTYRALDALTMIQEIGHLSESVRPEPGMETMP